MTEDNNPKPMKKTSAVPLRKETVRVTLKANPSDHGNSGAAGYPPAPAPTIPLRAPVSGPPAVPPPAPTAPTPPRAPIAPPTIKLQTAPNPVAAPTVAASSFAGAKNLVPPPRPSTLKIASPDFEEPKTTDTAVPEPAPTVGLDTPGTDQPAGASSQPLPKATVQLQPSQLMSVPAEGGGDSLLSTVSLADTEEAAAQRAEGTATVLSAIALVAAVIVLGVQLGTANIWVNDETHESPGWGRLFD
jgi:hypothetical protein